MTASQFLPALTVSALTIASFAMGVLRGTESLGLLGVASLAVVAGSVTAWSARRERQNVTRAIAEALAERYYANFLRPVAEAMTESPGSDASADSVLVLIPTDPPTRRALSATVAGVAVRREVEPTDGGRRFGVYVYKSDATTQLVDVPSTLGGIEETSPEHPPDARYAYLQFADRLEQIVTTQAQLGVSVRVVRDASDFPLADEGPPGASGGV